ncbi:MAG: hypothetical protein LUE86_00665 [Clostridiales bacterium]|nr:hypothetical protein [Clostridiales bacterium]
MINQNWQDDPRIRRMDAKKIAYLAEFAEQISALPRSQALSAFLAMQLDANRKQICFSDRETEQIIAVLCEGISPAEKKRMETLRMLARKMAARKS